MATTPAAPSAPHRSRSRRLTMALAAAAALALAGGLAYLVRGGQVQAAPAVQAVKPVFVAIEPLTVNLQTEGKPRFLHLALSLKVQDERAPARIAEAMPELRSRLLLLLSNRDPATLSTVAGKTGLAEEIRTELNRPLAAGLPPQGIGGVAFTAFVVQ